MTEQKDKYSEFLQTAQKVSQLQIFQALGGRDSYSKRLQMTKKINEMESQ